ncbi:unnamed protein product [Amoebophrya sp. A120]|nr:unnamed protein product [Amoebophrya sp. A120]|eukprot:GSA120T00021013001.1
MKLSSAFSAATGEHVTNARCSSSQLENEGAFKRLKNMARGSREIPSPPSATVCQAGGRSVKNRNTSFWGTLTSPSGSSSSWSSFPTVSTSPRIFPESVAAGPGGNQIQTETGLHIHSTSKDRDFFPFLPDANANKRTARSATSFYFYDEADVVALNSDNEPVLVNLRQEQNREYVIATGAITGLLAGTLYFVGKSLGIITEDGSTSRPRRRRGTSTAKKRAKDADSTPEASDQEDMED